MPLSTTVTRRFFNATTAPTTSYSDMFKTIAALLILGAMMAAVPMAIGLVSATFAMSVSLYAASLLIIVGAALFNYCFAAQFTQVALSAKPIEDNKKYGLLDVNLRKMANTLIDQANKKPGVVKLPKDILIANYNAEHDTRMKSVYGLNTSAAAIFIPSSILMSHVKKLTKEETAALLMLEIIKIRNAHTRRGFRNTICNVGCAFLSLFEDLDKSPYAVARLLGLLVGPLKFVVLFQASLMRTYQYKAMADLVQEGGTEYASHLKSAYAKLNVPFENAEDDFSLASPTTPSSQKGKKIGFYKSCAAWVLQVAKGMKEVFSDYPAANKTNDFLQHQIVKYPSIPTVPALIMPMPAKPKPVCTHCAHTTVPAPIAPAANDVPAAPANPPVSINRAGR